MQALQTRELQETNGGIILFPFTVYAVIKAFFDNMPPDEGGEFGGGQSGGGGAGTGW